MKKERNGMKSGETRGKGSTNVEHGKRKGKGKNEKRLLRMLFSMVSVHHNGLPKTDGDSDRKKKKW